jgi:hypothetical protein
LAEVARLIGQAQMILQRRENNKSNDCRNRSEHDQLDEPTRGLTVYVASDGMQGNERDNERHDARPCDH